MILGQSLLLITIMVNDKAFPKFTFLNFSINLLCNTLNRQFAAIVYSEAIQAFA